MYSHRQRVYLAQVGGQRTLTEHMKMWHGTLQIPPTWEPDPTLKSQSALDEGSEQATNAAESIKWH